VDWLKLEKQFPTRRKYVQNERAQDELAFLSKRNLEFTRSGAPEITRKKRLFNAACDFAGNDKQNTSSRTNKKLTNPISNGLIRAFWGFSEIVENRSESFLIVVGLLGCFGVIFYLIFNVRFMRHPISTIRDIQG
jgi:hypothetical protein